MESKQLLLSRYKNTTVRITKYRIELINVLRSKNHLTFDDIYEKMKSKGYENLTSLYNNLDFFIDEKIVTTLEVNNIKYYDLTLEDFSHSADNHIHLIDNQTNEIIEIEAESLFNIIKEHSSLENFEINDIRLTLTGRKIGK